MSPTDDSDCAIWIWGLGSSFCELRFLLVLPLVPVRDVKSCPFELHLEFELNESVNVLIMINIWFVFVIHVYTNFCSTLGCKIKLYKCYVYKCIYYMDY
jgi:hypothetical protein